MKENSTVLEKFQEKAKKIAGPVARVATVTTLGVGFGIGVKSAADAQNQTNEPSNVFQLKKADTPTPLPSPEDNPIVVLPIDTPISKNEKRNIKPTEIDHNTGGPDDSGTDNNPSDPDKNNSDDQHSNGPNRPNPPSTGAALHGNCDNNGWDCGTVPAPIVTITPEKTHTKSTSTVTATQTKVASPTVTFTPTQTETGVVTPTVTGTATETATATVTPTPTSVLTKEPERGTRQARGTPGGYSEIAQNQSTRLIGKTVNRKGGVVEAGAFGGIAGLSIGLGLENRRRNKIKFPTSKPIIR